MKLEVGQFVRTKDGTIGKIIAIDLAKPRQEKYPNHPSKKHWRDKILISCHKGWRTTQNIIKASYNIIDILEEGDYVNGCYIQEIKSLKDNVMVCMLDSDYEFLSKITNNEIETIVTKEQMEQMEYKIGE